MGYFTYRLQIEPLIAAITKKSCYHSLATLLPRRHIDYTIVIKYAVIVLPRGVKKGCEIEGSRKSKIQEFM